MMYACKRRSLLAAALGAPLLAWSRGSAMPAGPGPRLSGTYLQLLKEHCEWTHEDWTRLFEKLQRLQISRLVVQWVAIDDLNFHLSPPSGRKSSLTEILELAEPAGMKVMVGLNHDPAYWEKIAQSPDIVAAYLADREARSVRVINELIPFVESNPCFLGWYLCDEIDDTSWGEPAAAAILHSYLHRLSAYLRLTSPAALIAISGFSNARATAEQVQQFWDGLLRAAPAIGIVIFQDGIGVHKLTLDSLPVYAAAVRSATHSTERGFWSVVELFDQTGGKSPDTAPFRAVAAPFSRVLDQLRIEAAFTSDLIAFTAPDYMFSPLDPGASALFTAYLQYVGRSANRH
jgi:uncharacterized protein DUF4434